MDEGESTVMTVLVLIGIGLVLGFLGSNYLMEKYYRQYSYAQVLKCVEDGGQYQADGEALNPSARCNYGPKSVMINR